MNRKHLVLLAVMIILTGLIVLFWPRAVFGLPCRGDDSHTATQEFATASPLDLAAKANAVCA